MASRRENLAWAAGFIDGDGHFAYHHKRGLYLDVGQKYRDILERLQTALGVGTIYGPYRQAEGREMYSYRVNGPETVDVVEWLSEFLSPYRLRQAELAVRRWQDRPGVDRYMTKDEIAQVRNEYAAGGITLNELGEKYGRAWTTIQKHCIDVTPAVSNLGRYPLKHISPDDITMMRAKYWNAGMTQAAIADEYDVSQSYVQKKVAV